MKLLSLQLKNFRQYAETTVQFGPGVTAIVGPNGAGKSTLLEAIAWALYGSPALRGSNDSLRRANAPARSPVEVTLEFALGSHKYRIFRRPDRAEFFVDGSPSPAHSGVQPVSDAVRKLLGMDYRAFFTSYFTGQKELAFLAGMGKQERATAVGRMLGYDRLTRAREKSNQDRLALDKEIEGVQRGMGDASAIAQALSDAESALKAAVKESEAAKKRHEKASAALEKITPKYELSLEKKKHYDDLAQQFKDTERDRDHTGVNIQSFRQEIARLETLKEELHALQPQVKEFKEAQEEFNRLSPLLKFEKERQTLAARIADLTERIRQSREEAEGLEAARSVHQSLEIQIKNAEKAEAELRDDIERMKREWGDRKAEIKAEGSGYVQQRKTLQDRRARVQQLGDQGDCPTCARPLRGGEMSSVLAHFDDELREINRLIQEAQTRLMALGNEAPEVPARQALFATRQNELSLLREREREADRRRSEMEKADRMMRNLMKDLSDAQNRLHELPTGFDEARYQIVFEIGKRLQPVNKRSVEIENEMKRYPEWSQRLRDGENQWALQAERLDEIEKKMKALKFAPEAHAKLEAEYDDAVAEERSAERAALEANASRGRAEGAAQTARENQAEFQRKAETLREMQSRRLYLRTLTEGLEKLRLDLNARVRPDLEEVASDFLKDLTDGRYTRIDLTEQYEPFIVDDGERKAVISGGEEDVTHLCLRLAISRMIAERSGQPLSLLVLDEIFGSLDASRRDNVVILLQRLKAVFEQIILITHIESLHDVVDQCLWVTLDTASRTSRISETREGSLDLPFDPLDGSLADEDVPEAA